MSAGASHRPRFQDLSRQEAFSVEARVLQRMLPLLLPKKGARRDELEGYFTALTDFSYSLAELGLANTSIEDARPQGQKFHNALNCSRFFVDKSVPAAEAVMCVTDALGELGLIRYFPAPGLSARDRTNPDLVMLTAEAAFTLSKFGIKEEVFQNPVTTDCAYVFKHRSANEPSVGGDFFERALWPIGGPSLADRSKPFGFEVIEDDWSEVLNGMGLSGVVATYKGLLDGMHPQQRHKAAPKGANVVNNVTLNFSTGASFTGPLAVGQNIKLSYEMASDTKKNDLRGKLEELVGQASKLAETIQPEERKNDVSCQLKTFVEEAKKDKPSKWALNVSSAGLLEAAKTVASLAEPITTSVKAVMALINPIS